MALKGQALRKLMLIATAFALSTVTACGSPTTASKNNQGAAKDTPAPAAPDTPAPRTPRRPTRPRRRWAWRDSPSRTASGGRAEHHPGAHRPVRGWR